MKKIFSFMLMAMLSTVMAWAGTIKVGGENPDYPATLAGLNDAIAAATVDDVVLLGEDINYGNLTTSQRSSSVNIKKSITIDGGNHTLKGSSFRPNGSYNNATIWINQDGTQMVDVTIRNLTIVNERTSISGDNNAYRFKGIETRGKINSVTLDHVSITAKSSAFQLGGDHTGQSVVSSITMTNCNLTASPYYAFMSYNPSNLTMTDCKITSWAGLYYKGIDSSAGSRGSVANLTRCDFECLNLYSGRSNAFGVFVCEDDGIDITATNCKINSSAVGDQAQSLLLASGEYLGQNRRTQPISLTLAGDNTRIIMDGYFYSDIDVKAVETFNNNTWYYYDAQGYGPAGYGIVPFSVTITGGTYDVNPMYYRHVTAVNRDGEGNPIMDGDKYSVVTQSPIIPTGYAIIEVQDGDKTLYRVTSDNISYDINGKYETEDAGENPTTSFIVETTDDQPIELTNNETEAAYVQVRDNASGDATVLLVGKVENPGTPSEAKVDQTLIVNNGLDVQGESQVIVQSGSALIIGEGGVVTEKSENIVIESTEEAQGALLMDPAISVNQNPKLTVKLKTHSKLNAKKSPTKWEYTYQRFAIPVMLATAGYVTNDFNPATNEYFDEEEASVGFESYVWQWTGMQWETTTWNALERSIGYQLSNNSKKGDVTYTFTGNLIGNTNTLYEFDVKGFKFFGNSYTAPIMIEELLNGFKEIYPDVEASVWVYNYANKGWKSVNLDDIADGFAYATTIKSMDGFILNLRSANSGVAGVDYTSAIWNNPDINPNATPAPARRSNASAVSNSVVINVTSANFADEVTFVEREDRDLSFENGADASKFMNENGLNIYAETPAGSLSRVATDNLLGTQITFDAENDNMYTLSFSNVRGDNYALRDNVTGKVIDLVEGETYTFTQAANTSVKNRFEIVASHKMPTAVENVETSAKTKGIYTILGQYMGETTQWSTLPAGVYVVDGVKVVK